MIRKSHMASPVPTTLTRFLGATLAAAALAAPAQAAVINFESGYATSVASGEVFVENGYQLYFADRDQTSIGTAAGAMVDATDVWACPNTSCPTNGDGMYYAATNSSFVWLSSQTGGAFQIKSIDASFLGAGVTLSGFPILSGYLRMQAFRADDTYELIDLPLFGPASTGFEFGTYTLNDPWSSMDFVEVAMFGFACNTAGTCSRLDTNEAQFAIDNIVLEEAVAAVPEPGTAAIFGLGLMGLVAGARRRKS